MRANIHNLTNRVNKAFQRTVIAAALSAPLTGCLLFPVNVQPHTALTPLPPKEDHAPAMAELKDIKTALNLEEKTIILVTSAPAKYTSYMMEHPPRVAVEIRQITSRIPSAPIIVDDELVEKISVLEFKKAGVARVEIMLKRSAQHAVVTADNGIEIKIFPIEEHRDPALLAQRLMEAEARASALEEENQELKALLEKQEKQSESLSAPPALAENAPAEWEQFAAQPGWKEKAKADILALLERWRKTQEEKDFTAYAELYSPGFQHEGLSRAKWLERAKARFDNPNKELVRVFGRYVKISQGVGRVDFKAQFLAKDGSSAETHKMTIILGWTPQGWGIESETGTAKP